MIRARDEQSVVLSTVVQVLRTVSGNDRAGADEPLSLYFPDSLSGVAFIAELGRTLDRQLPATLFWDCRTGRDLSRLVAIGHETSVSSVTSAARAAEPVAVIGMACRFPGAQDLDGYWRLMSEGLDAVVECPPDRVDDVLGDFAADMASSRGGFLRDVGQFDAAFFGFSRREALAMDPQQRLLLEVTHEALENSGTLASGGSGSRFGVFVGAMWNDYARLFGPSDLSAYSATGLDLSILSARLSHHFGWEGPSLTVNTACSSSLVATQMGCESLRAGESDVVIAGGVNLILSPSSGVALTKFGALSSSGRCSSFDGAADGYVRGEGCGIVVLKRLEDAIANGDRVLGVVSGWAVNNNGLSAGLTAPSRHAQEKLLRDALAKSGRNVEDITYVEAHGTGTILGDPIEAQALASVYSARRSNGRPLLLGSIKTNIGHLESAAGIAGLIKVLLAIGKRRIPKQLHFSTPNPHIDFAGNNLEVVNHAIDWTDEVGPRCAGVSSFGFGGTNCHLVVEAGDRWVPEAQIRIRRNLDTRGAQQVAEAVRRSLFVFSGQGGHWSGMGESLLRVHDDFSSVLRQLDNLASARLEQRPSKVLISNYADLRDRADYSWPIQTAMQLALVDLWKKLGIVPDVVAGHSIGEIAAAYAIGAITRETALQISLVLGRWAAARDGSMAVVDLDWDLSEALLNTAVPNCRRVIDQDDGHTVLSGPRQEMALIQKQCLERAIAFRPVKGTGMVHCPIAPEERAALMAELGTIDLHRASTPLYSGLVGGPVPGGGLTSEHWTRCVTEPVYWRQALAAALQVGLSDVVEISTHPLLLHSVKLSSSQPTGLVLSSLVRGRAAGATIGDAAAQLQDHGHPVTWEAFARPSSGASDALGSVSQVFVVSGKSKAALAAQIRRMVEFVEQNTEGRLEDLCFTAAVHRTHHPFRRAITAATLDDLRRGLHDLEIVDVDPSFAAGGAEPLANVYFGSSMAASDAFISRLIRAPEFAWHWSRSDHVLVDVHRTIGRGDGAADTECLALRLQLAIWATLQSWGVAAADFSGSGVGTLAAACASGTITLRVAFETICRGDSMPDQRRDTGAANATPQLVLGDDVGDVSSARSTADLRVSEVALEGLDIWPHLLSRLYEIGIAVQWRGLFSPRCEIVNLPTYAWQREQYWPTERKGQPKQTINEAPPGPAGIYKLDWFPADIPSARVPPGAWGRAIIFAPADIARFARTAMATNALWVTPGDKFEQLSATELAIDPRKPQDFAGVLDLAGTSSCRVLYLWGMKAASAGTTVVDAMLDGAIHLTHAILARSPRQFELSVVTAGLHQAAGGQADTPIQALIWGLFRSFRLEVPQLRQRLVDIAVPDLMSTNGTFVAQLKTLLESNADHAESAWRGDREFVPVLTLVPADVRASRTTRGGDRATEVHLITGGSGALGLKVAQRLVSSGVKRVALMSRSQPGPRAHDTAAELRRAGAEIVFVSADADKKDELSHAISVIEATMGPISHVVHAAGVLRAAPLDSLDSEGFWGASAGKISALRNIEALLDLTRVRLVLISSVSAIFGLSRHSPYAAANAYIDAFAIDRRRKGLNVRSIAFGPLADSDMLTRSHGKSDFPGLPAMAIDDALDRLDIFSSDDLSDRIVMVFDHDVWRSLGNAAPGLAMADAAPAARERKKTPALPPSPSSLAAALAAVLTRDVGSSEWDIPFSELGLDSMMGMDLRDRIRSQFGADIPVSALYNFPTVNSLARLLLESSSGSIKSHIGQPKYSLPADATLEEKTVESPLNTDISVETMIIDELRSLGYR